MRKWVECLCYVFAHSNLRRVPQEIPVDELEARDTDKIIDVFHFTKEPSRTHGVPFRFVVLPDEKFSDTKKRLQARMGIPDGGMAKYRFALVQMAQFKQPTYLADGASIVWRDIVRILSSPLSEQRT
jgi:hypothetical protein